MRRARTVVDTWLSSPVARILTLQENHMQEVIRLMAESNCSGLLASDDSLAVYAMKHRAVLHSNDSDFSRFSGLNWRNPLVV